MSVKLPSGSHVDFPQGSNMVDLLSKTITLWWRRDDAGKDSYIFLTQIPLMVGTSYYLWYEHTNSRFIFVYKNWATHLGQWCFDFLPVIGQWYHLAVTYNRSSIANDPLFYLDGVNKTPFYETDAPAGASTAEDPTYKFCLGSNGAPVSNESIEDIRLYNRILTPTEILGVKNENIHTVKAINDYGLVFHAPCVCAKGLTLATYPGATLGVANTFIERTQCLLGTPAQDFGTGAWPIGDN